MNTKFETELICQHSSSQNYSRQYLKNCLRKRSSIFLFPICVLTTVLLLISSNTHAGFCTLGTVKEVGTWVNPDVNTRGITKAIFNEECRHDPQYDKVENGIGRTSSAVKTVYTAEVWGACQPEDCYWGKVDGVYTSADWLRFRYEFTFAEKMVWAQIWSDGDNWLRLIVDTDFDSPLRNDYRFDEWMQRQ